MTRSIHSVLIACLVTAPLLVGAESTTPHHKRRHSAAAKPAAAKTVRTAKRNLAGAKPRAKAASGTRKKVAPRSASAEASAKPKLRKISYTRTAGAAGRNRRRALYSPWKTPTFADSTIGDLVDGEDLEVRRAAVQALGPYNGSVVVTDPDTGRVLAMVNQKLALSAGYEPCSTIKIVASLAGLSEGIIDPESERAHPRRRFSYDLTNALAFSNNAYFASVGTHLGFDKITDYARLLGMGERAGLNIDGEQFTPLPEAPPADGLGMMTSFGEGFYFTPLQLSAIVSAVANGGTLYYLQYPRTQAEIDQFVPRVKRHLEISSQISQMLPGMMGAVEFGTAQRAQFDADRPIFGKTGTCTDNRSPTHLGWFASFQQVGTRRLSVVVLLTGGHAVSGPVASGVAGSVYRNLNNAGYYAEQRAPISPAAMVSSGDAALR